MENKDELEEVAFFDVSVYEDKTATIEMLDNGKLSEYISDAMIKDDNILSVILEVFIKYQYKIENNSFNKNNTKNKVN